MDGVEVYRWFLTASPFELRIVYFNSQLVDFTSQTAMRSRINYALHTGIQQKPSVATYSDRPVAMSRITVMTPVGY